VIAHEHSWSYQGQPLRRLLDRYVIAAGADRFIAVSQADRRRMTEVEGISPERTLFIPNGIPSSQATAGRDLRAELGIDPSAPVIGSVGSLYPVKAFDVLLRATVTLVRDRPDTKLLLVGEGAQREALEALSRELRLESSVRFLGDRGDVRDILETFNVAVCCSWSEGSPLSVMEYMDAGLPVVATTVGGLPDLVAPDVNGLLVAPGDPSALAASISVLLADPERARAMGARGAERRSREFDIDVLAGRLGDLYIELLEQKAARRAR
jgi:glycosyltransferase involved in cell wall biosynthesis